MNKKKTPADLAWLELGENPPLISDFTPKYNTNNLIVEIGSICFWTGTIALIYLTQVLL